MWARKIRHQPHQTGSFVSLSHGQPKIPSSCQVEARKGAHNRTTAFLLGPGGLPPQYTVSGQVYASCLINRSIAELNQQQRPSRSCTDLKASSCYLSLLRQDGPGSKPGGTTKAPACALLQWLWAAQAETTRANFDTRYPPRAYSALRTRLNGPPVRKRPAHQSSFFPTKRSNLH